MTNPPGPDQPDDVTDAVAETGGDRLGDGTAAGEAPTEAIQPDPEHEPVTEVMAPAQTHEQQPDEQSPPPERRFTAPSGFDAGSTQRIDTPADPATEVFATPPGAGGPVKPVAPQHIPPRDESSPAQPHRRSWGWVVALLLVIAALVAVAVLGTVLLTRASTPKVSQEDQVRQTIETFDTAIQNGDLATLRSITCGAKRDSYVRYDDKTWAEIHKRVAAAKRYPVVASIDQVVVNGDHAEANVTAFMAYAPQTRSTRSFDLEFRDEQWKVCQAPVN
ncbi:Rv0361 family membrane protein [Mycolicibacterium sp. XJ1819]